MTYNLTESFLNGLGRWFYPISAFQLGKQVFKTSRKFWDLSSIFLFSCFSFYSRSTTCISRYINFLIWSLQNLLIVLDSLSYYFSTVIRGLVRYLSCIRISFRFIFKFIFNCSVKFWDIPLLYPFYLSFLLGFLPLILNFIVLIVYSSE